MALSQAFLIRLKDFATQYAREQCGDSAQAEVTEIEGNKVQFHFYTLIDCQAQFLLILQPNESTPSAIIVNGSDLYQAAITADDYDPTLTQTKTLEAGVEAYLKLDDRCAGIKISQVKIRKLPKEIVLPLLAT